MTSSIEARRPWSFSLFRDIFGSKEPVRGEVERRKLAQVSCIRTVRSEDLIPILSWSSDPETRRHLDPPPPVPNDWNNQDEVGEAIKVLENYYRNNGDNPRNIVPLIAANATGKPVGVLTIRWRGDPYIPEGKRIASVERLIVDPDLRHLEIGTELFTAALLVCFDAYKGYAGRGAEEIRGWIMADIQAGDFSVNLNFFRKFGFETVQGERRHWREFAVSRGIQTDRDGLLLSLKREKWDSVKQNNPDLINTVIPKIDLLNLRL